MASERSKDYHAIVDMGSNGIRFSITDLSPASARSMPTVFLDRAGISLYDAQYQPNSNERSAIPKSTIDRVVNALRRFKRVCTDFGVPEDQVRFLATEATRTATNSEAFRERIESSTGWHVEMLPKEEEGRIGAMGVASSYPVVKGLVMDLGGGSTQLTWLISTGNGAVLMPQSGSVSMPYGAAALTRRLAEADSKRGTAAEKARASLKDEIEGALRDAVQSLTLPTELQEQLKSDHGLSLYLSGGGFRGWGYVLMSRHPVQPYPIPIINGFKTSTEAFHDVPAVQEAVSAAQSEPTTSDGIFRVSDRRASQVPAVGFLVSCLASTLQAINRVHFCQGGVREGALFSQLSQKVRAQHPLVVASSAAAPRSNSKLLDMLDAALPKTRTTGYRLPAVLTREILQVLVNALHAHAPVYKDLRAASALRYTTTGDLAAVHGVSHVERATLALALCERWGGKSALAPSDADFYGRLVALVVLEDEMLAWWCLFAGRAAAVLGELYPAGLVREGQAAKISTGWTGAGEAVVEMRLSDDLIEGEQPVVGENVLKALKKLDRCGKKKNWHDGRGFKTVITAKAGDQLLDFNVSDQPDDD